MKKHLPTVIVECDVICDWTGEPPRYRVWVEKELFTERTWIWQDVMLQECLQIRTAPGKYNIWFELLDRSQAILHVKNWRVSSGPGWVDQNGWVDIRDENV